MPPALERQAETGVQVKVNLTITEASLRQPGLHETLPQRGKIQVAFIYIYVLHTDTCPPFKNNKRGPSLRDRHLLIMHKALGSIPNTAA